MRIHGIGPKPIENAVMNSIKLTRGRNPILSTVSFEMKLSGSIVVAVVVIIIVVVVLLLSESLHSSPHCSYRRKKTATMFKRNHEVESKMKNGHPQISPNEKEHPKEVAVVQEVQKLNCPRPMSS